MTAPLGANVLSSGRASFAVWAPRARSLSVELPGAPGRSVRSVQLVPDGPFFRADIDDVGDGQLYSFVFEDGRHRPDPRSRRAPQGVHGPSALVDLAALGVRPRPRLSAPADWVIYEIHVGTFTRGGTLDAAIPRLASLRELGISAVELMPVSPFPGTRNWGYDGVQPYAVQESYGGPAALARFVNAAHELGLAVLLDLVYNHLGPEGNYLRDFGPYFTDRHHTPWGEAVNYDGEGSAEVRRYVVDNAVQWAGAFQIDGLRLDAIHAVFDSTTPHVLSEVAAAAQALGCAVISESDLNDPVTVRRREEGGWGHDAQWTDDLNHAVHALLTDERHGYFVDFGKAGDLVQAYQRGFVHDGTRMSRFRGGLHGKSSAGIPIERHVVALQNHDQIGNRARGDRLDRIVGEEALKTGAVAVLMTPGIPLLFMGQEWAARQPFLYFTSHGDRDLGKAVTEGRKKDFQKFGWKGDVPDPQDPATFDASILDPADADKQPHRGVLALHRRLLRLRRSHPALQGSDRSARSKALADEVARTVQLERWAEGGPRLLVLMAFAGGTGELRVEAAGTFRLVLDTADALFDGPGRTAPDLLQGGQAVHLAAPCAWIFECARARTNEKRSPAAAGGTPE